MSLPQNVMDTIKKFNMFSVGDRVVLGLSGGADSCVLLYVLAELKKELGITLFSAHLHHGIRGAEADRDLESARAFSESLDIPFLSKHVNVPKYAKENKISEETAGRKLRYRFFEEVCKEYNCNKIVVAHNKNDSAETIVLNLIRGSGSNGFGGIKATNGKIVRPLIETSRTDIENFSIEKGILYVNDSTNFCDIYARNIVRNEILPQMSRINLGAINNIVKCSEILSAENDFFESYISEHSFFDIENGEAVISRTKLEKAHIALGRRVVLSAMKSLTGSTNNISFKQIDALISNIKTGLTHAFGNGYYAVVNSDSVIITNNLKDIVTYEYEVKPPCTIQIGENGDRYSFQFVNKPIFSPQTLCICADFIKDNSLVMRSRKDGDSFVPFGMKGSKKLKNFFIEQKIPAYLRSEFPILVNGDEICAVLPLRTSEKYRINSDTTKILMITKLGGTYDEKC